MKRFLAILLVILFMFQLAACKNEANEEPEAIESASVAKEWLEEKIENNSLFSFKYNGAEFSSFISSWEKNLEEGVDEEGRTTYTLTYTSPEQVTVTALISYDAQMAALDWVCSFKNNGSGDSPVISNILPLDAEYSIEAPTLMTANGNSDNTVNDFEATVTDLSVTNSVKVETYAGRSSQGALPYFDICNGTEGLLGAIGWTGQWTAWFNSENGAVRMSAGMTSTKISLHANEEMRTPSIVLTFFKGDRDAGHNQFRKLVLKSYSPKDENGQSLTYLPSAVGIHCPDGEKKVLNTIELLDLMEMDYELMWFDAGWSGKMQNVETGILDWSAYVGDWYVNPDIWPDGFSKVSEVLAENDRELLVWFEPERVMPLTQMYEEHPEYFLASSESASFELLDYTNDEVVDYIIDTVDALIKENGVSWYRQDANFNPHSKWTLQDSREGENREGITEIKYITGYYRYIDTLLERNPGLMMDNCASGGRRLDIESMKRSVSLWCTDYTVDVAPSDADGVRQIIANLSYWLPLVGCGGGGTDGLDTVYKYRSQMSSHTKISPSYSQAALYNRMYEEYLRCRELNTGDYYIISQGTASQYMSVNAVYEYYRPETGEGYIAAFRPLNSAKAQQPIKLKGLEKEATYLVEVSDSGETAQYTGEELMSGGFGVTIEEQNTSVIIFITKQ